MKMIGGVWSEQNRAFCGLSDAHASLRVAPGICNLPSEPPVPVKHTDTPRPCVWGSEKNRFSLLFLLFISIDAHMCGTSYSRVRRVHLALHALIIWSLSFFYSYSSFHFFIFISFFFQLFCLIEQINLEKIMNWVQTCVAPDLKMAVYKLAVFW